MQIEIIKEKNIIEKLKNRRKITENRKIFIIKTDTLIFK